jgi:predicted ATPase/class 3 adenylate cyclase
MPPSWLAAWRCLRAMHRGDAGVNQPQRHLFSERSCVGEVRDALWVGVRPTGTLTFLFTDVEGSSRLWECYPTEMDSALRLHDEIVRSAIEGHGGYVFSTGGDAFAAAFSRVGEAIGAQAGLASASWPESVSVRVRMGIHTGEATERDGNYFGPTLNRAARLMSAGHGGQTLVSSVAAQLYGGADLVDLGEHRLRDLGERERIWQIGRESFAALRTLDQAPNNLPVQRTALLGRETALQVVMAHLEQHRLVSLLGMGGSGKTRLAQAVAAATIDRFPDGVWFVDLVPVTSPSDIPIAVASAAGFDLGAHEPFEGLLHVMVARRALFILDNCEHLTDGVAELVDAILERTSEATFLVTSREPLDLPDEQHYPVDPLDASDSTSPAVTLFTSTAARIGSPIPGSALDAVAEICRRLDGLPLAIELAAGQLGHLSPNDILERLDRRFELLSAGRGRRRQRHVSLQAVLQDTWGMLDETEQDLLQHLAAFPASFDLEIAEAVFGDGTAKALAGLVDRSLVVPDAARSNYRLFETVKMFARQRWSERDNPNECLDRHADALINQIRSWSDDDIYSLNSVAAWHARRLHDLRAADDYLYTRGDIAGAATLWTAGVTLWEQGQPATSTSVLERIDRCLKTDRLNSELVARAELAAVCAAMATRRQQRIVTSAKRAVDAALDAGSDVVRAFALHAMSWMTMVTDLQGALELLRESERVAAAAGARFVGLTARAYQACALPLHQVDGALQLMDEVETANDGAATYVANSLANIRIIGGLFAEPERTAAEYARRVEALEPFGLGGSFQHANLLAVTKAGCGDARRTIDALIDTEARIRQTGNDDGLPDLLIAPAVLAYMLGNIELASRWTAAVRLAAKPTQNLPTTAIYRQLRQRVGLAQNQPGLDNTAAVYTEARAWVTKMAEHHQLIDRSTDLSKPTLSLTVPGRTVGAP